MKINMLMAGLALTTASFFTSCSDDEGTPAGTGNVILAVNTTSSTTGNADGRVAAANDLTFTSGKITIREVVFDGENGSQSVSRTIEQIAFIDYATGSVTPEVVVEVPAGITLV